MIPSFQGRKHKHTRVSYFHGIFADTYNLRVVQEEVQVCAVSEKKA